MSQRARVRFTVIAITLGVIALPVAGTRAQTSSPLPQPNPYRVDETFKLEMPQGLQSLGAVSGVEVGSDGNLYVLHRCVDNSCAGHDNVPPILVYSPQGRLLKTLAAGMLVWPHGMQVMPDLSIWVTDAVASNGVNPKAPGKGHQVLHLDKDGNVLLALGTPGVSGAGQNTFNAPSDVVIGRNGDIFVADGHGMGTNTRIVKFNRDGKYIKEWGTRGPKPGQFEVPHGLAIDSQGRLFVADRANNRIQIFDQDGNFLAELKQFGRPSGIAIDQNDVLYVTDTQTTRGRPGFQNGIYIGSARDGKVTGYIPKNPALQSTWEGDGEGRTNMEGIGNAPDGSAIYGAEVGLMTVVKFVRR